MLRYSIKRSIYVAVFHKTTTFMLRSSIKRPIVIYVLAPGRIRHQFQSLETVNEVVKCSKVSFMENRNKSTYRDIQ